jgi:hypothetical protein
MEASAARDLALTLVDASAARAGAVGWGMVFFEPSVDRVDEVGGEALVVGVIVVRQPRAQFLERCSALVWRRSRLAGLAAMCSSSLRPQFHVELPAPDGSSGASGVLVVGCAR